MNDCFGLAHTLSTAFYCMILQFPRELAALLRSTPEMQRGTDGVCGHCGLVKAKLDFKLFLAFAFI